MRRRDFTAAMTITLGTNDGSRAARVPAARKRVALLSDAEVESLKQSMLRTWSSQGINVDIEANVGSVYAAEYLAGKVVDEKADLIIALGTPWALAAQAATSVIPIIFIVLGDPIRFGLTSQLRVPSRNSTGIYTRTAELAAKQVELLHIAAPRAVRLGILGPPPQMEDTRNAIATLGLTPVDIGVREAPDVPGALGNAIKQRIEGLCVLPAPPVFVNLRFIVEFAAQHRLPSVSGYARFAEGGGLISYHANNEELLRRVVDLAGKVIRGATPASIPIEQAQRFELTINARTAREIGLPIPQELKLRADRVIG